MGLVQLAVGQKFPVEYHRHDGAALALAEASFNVIISLGRPTSGEIKAFRTGKISVGVAVVEHIPMVVVDCPGLGWPVELMTALKTAAFEQLTAYPSAGAVYQKITEILSVYTTDQLIQLAHMYTFGG